MKLYSIRHGEYARSHDALGRKLVHNPYSILAPLGELQIHQLGEEFKKGKTEKLDTLYTSPFERARKTAQVLANKLGIDYVVMEELKDIYPNSAKGQPEEEVALLAGAIFAHPLAGRPQESLDHLVTRVRATMKLILKEAKVKKYTAIGIISHGDTLSAIDWVLKHSINPAFYGEMRNAFYLQKAEACAYTLDDQFRLVGEGVIISVEAVKESIEGFRGSHSQEIE